MSEEMQQEAIKCAERAFESHKIEKDIAKFIKRKFDQKYNSSWHCIVGRKFGAYVTHLIQGFIDFYRGKIVILLFKTA